MTKFSEIFGSSHKRWSGYEPWTGHYEIDLIELGKHVANAYDERHEVIYRIGTAAGYPRTGIINWKPESEWWR